MEQIKGTLGRLREELEARCAELLAAGRIVEAQRLRTRTEYDLEMMAEMGHCPGIENYSGPLSGRPRGEPPSVLLDYFGDGFLTFVDESHVSLPQIGAMYAGDRARKQNLVDYGFRLPSAMDNRPLKYEEFEQRVGQTIFVSATPSAEEARKAGAPVEQLIRPTGLVDPVVEVRPSEGQMEDIYTEIQKRIAADERCLILTLTKRMAEELTEYLGGLSLKVRYIHSEVETIERVEILKQLRSGDYDVLVGINLLREGIDLPEVSFIAVLDADKIGFLRSATSLIQIIGRAARNAAGSVVLYADRMSTAMATAIDETSRRRAVQEAWNAEHGITPITIKKAINDILERHHEERETQAGTEIEILRSSHNLLVPEQKKSLIRALEARMLEHAKNLEFEQAALIRDEIERVRRNDA
jgi:excinuclease ABC subunit B